MPFCEIAPEIAFSISVTITGPIFIVMALQALSAKQLIERCVAKEGNREDCWSEFKRRFDKLISIFIYREFRQNCGDAAARRADFALAWVPSWRLVAQSQQILFVVRPVVFNFYPQLQMHRYLKSFLEFKTR